MTTKPTTPGGGLVFDLAAAPLVTQAHPWLLIHHGKKRERQIFYSISKEIFYKRKIPELHNKVISTSCNGWLVIEDRDNEECFLFSLSTKEKIRLPQLLFAYRSCILSSPPSDGNCQILFINRSFSSIMILQLGEAQEFHEHDMGDANFSCATYFQGKFYFVDRRNLVFLDFSGPIPHLVKVMTKDDEGCFMSPIVTNSRCYLVESDGELLYVEKLYTGLFSIELLGFSIFRADFHETKWVKLKDLGQRAIFLDDTQGISVSVTPQEGNESSETFKGNCIYFTEDFDRCLYVFDVEEQTTTRVLPSSEVNKRHGFERRWVMMSS